MSTIYKEWLQQKIADMEAARDEIPLGLNEDDSNTLAALRIALASLELERGMIRRFDLDMSDCDSCGQYCGADMVEDLDGEYVLWDEVLPHLYRYDEYTAPPAPVSVPTFEEWCEQTEQKPLGWVRDAMKEAYDACRAAMLQGADGNSPVIPDGLRLALSNAGIAAPESDEMLAATCEKYIQALVTWVKDRKPFKSAVPPDGWVMVPVELTPEMRAAWDSAPNTDDDDYNMQAGYRAMIAAAPQQVVK